MAIQYQCNKLVGGWELQIQNRIALHGRKCLFHAVEGDVWKLNSEWPLKVVGHGRIAQNSPGNQHLRTGTEVAIEWAITQTLNWPTCISHMGLWIATGESVGFTRNVFQGGVLILCTNFAPVYVTLYQNVFSREQPLIVNDRHIRSRSSWSNTCVMLFHCFSTLYFFLTLLIKWAFLSAIIFSNHLCASYHPSCKFAALMVNHPLELFILIRLSNSFIFW